MKVLHLNEHLNWAGGVETYLLSTIPELESRGHSQGIVYARGQDNLVAESYIVPELSMGTRRAEAVAESSMNEILESFRPDIVHLHQVYNLGAVRACLKQVPVLVHGHDYRYLCPASTFYHRRSRTACKRTAGPGCFPTTLIKHCMSPRPSYALNYYRRVRWFTLEASRFCGVIAPSESARDRFLEAGFGASRVTKLPYFCPLEPANKPRSSPTQPTVLFVGRIRANKGVDIFLEAFARLGKEVQAILVGDFTDVSRRDVLKTAETLGFADRMVLHNWVDREKVRAVFEQATVFAFPSVWPETLGIVGIESLACGVPVVASDIGGVREWLKQGKTGLLVKPKDPVALATAIEKLLFDTSLNTKLGRNGIALVRDHFSRSDHITRLLQIYALAVQNRTESQAVL